MRKFFACRTPTFHSIIHSFDGPTDFGGLIERVDIVSQTSPTPVVGAVRLYAFYENGDLLAPNLQCEKIWHRSLANEYGESGGDHGIGSSIALPDDAVIVLIDHSNPSYLLNVNQTDGTSRWNADREKRVS